MKFGVVTFPGSNCDQDAHFAIRTIGGESVKLWHKDTSIPSDLDGIILPGGFSYGDYLRTGAIARFSPIMNEVIRFANAGGLVVGICNGFQILCEAGLLPGALIRNENLSFVCKDVYLRVENNDTPWTNAMPSGTVLRIPIAHGEGRYTASEDVVSELEATNRIVFRYVTAAGDDRPEANPNGSMHNIAGIVNAAGNVMGMMPHPERAVDALNGGTDGLAVFHSIVSALQKA
jgi:phosphoribosylformylglycinamidine synthase